MTPLNDDRPPPVEKLNPLQWKSSTLSSGKAQTPSDGKVYPTLSVEKVQPYPSDEKDQTHLSSGKVQTTH